jgi:hypothetical protein
MKVRQLIRALAKHDLDLEVVIPVASDQAAFVGVAGVEEEIFAADRQAPAHLRLAKSRDEGVLVAVRLRAQPDAAPH